MSALLARMREVWRAEMADQIRDELRQGATIAEVMDLDPMITKRMVEEQRAFLRQTEGLADTRKNNTGAEVLRLTAAGLGVDEIAAALRISTSSVYHHRQKQKKV